MIAAYLDSDEHMDKWIYPITRNSIKALKGFIALLSHPIMARPIEDLGLQQSTVDELKLKTRLKYGADLALFTEWHHLDRVGNSAGDIWTTLGRHGIEPGALDSLAEKAGLQATVNVRLSRATNETVNFVLNEVISKAKNELDSHLEQRKEQLEKLHIVRIDLPTSLTLMNTEANIADSAQEVLHVAFSQAVTNKAEDQVSVDVRNMLTKKPSDGLVDRIIDFINRPLSFGSQKPQQHTAQYVDSSNPSSFALEFGVKVELPKEPHRERALTPIFASVAEELSGKALTQKVCNALSTRVGKPHTPPEGLDWISVQSPY